MQMHYGYAGFNLHCFFMIQYLHTDYKFISIFHPFPITKITCMHALLKKSLGVTCSLQHTAASLTIYQVVTATARYELPRVTCMQIHVYKTLYNFLFDFII